MGFYLLSYLCIGVFILAAASLVYRQLTLPVHVRWEIYPVQHEPSAKASYGGSYMEEIDWWNKEQRPSLLNELRYMVPEILLIRGLWKENRALWWFSFPFHFGLYLMIATFGLLLLHAVLTLWGVVPAAGNTPLENLIAVAGWGGLVLGNAGCLGLLYRRLTDAELRSYASFVDYFNLGFIFLFFLFALAAALSDPGLAGARGYVFGLLTGGGFLGGDPAAGPGAAGGGTIILASLLAAYIPLTHMSHMFMKYFLYHKVKWDDTPNRPGSRIEAAVRKNLELRPTWGAKHVEADGKRTWREIASSAPKEMK